MSNEQRIEELSEKIVELNAVSPTMCLAKWKQTTTTLFNGMTHSCHHPAQHKINVEDIKKNPRGLHNTPIKIVAREDMLKGIQTKECDYCWNIENLSEKHFSDRHYKSINNLWDSFDEVIDSGKGENIDPDYLEIAFDSTCNFKCIYCSPDVSSRWMEEIQQHGPYKLKSGLHHDLRWLEEQGRMPIHHRDENPYIDAFWQWWPELHTKLKTFRITGGEPLLSKHTWRVLEFLANNEQPNLEFGINTNMGVPTKLLDQLIEKVNKMSNTVKQVQVYTSAESTGDAAEYARFGLVWEEFKANCERFLESTPDKVKLHFMMTINVLSVTTLDNFLEWIASLRRRFNKSRGENRIGMSASYLRWPFFLCLTELDDKQKKIFTDKITKLCDESTLIKVDDWEHPNRLGKLYIEEVDMLKRMLDFMNSRQYDPKQLKDFVNYIDEYDGRRDLNFFEVFPDLTLMYDTGVAVQV